MRLDYFPNKLRTLFVLAALLIVTGSVLFTNHLADELAEEERKKMELWAEATRQFIMADETADIDFFSTIIEQNTTIPVYMVGEDGTFLFSRNVREPKQHVGAFYAQRIKELQETSTPIEVHVAEGLTQYIYYEESTLLRRLYYFPFVQFTVIFLFVLITVYTLYTVQRSEQDRVWAGLSKETAHQLGTPISSLNAWSELLAAKYPDDALLPEMNKDIVRLQSVAERFSKVGSEPALEEMNIVPVIEGVLDYMRKRTSDKVVYTLLVEGAEVSAHTEPIMVMLNKVLFEWVVENLCKNAVDAMENRGIVTLSVATNDNKVCVDIADTGKGIGRKHFKDVFKPGYTTKQRGWGLGLSLAARIVEQYHKGKIFVKHSSPTTGTVFRMVLDRVVAQ
ncbi:MAG: HAMP domain-containing histidine kinase [Paludibacter sp.]|nr:HAMP domain-containing histidine kinase [Bacteroidales bacterium]MCM1068840.1 HAMP domain-containing histidine kinase [Prevotella sp.]MCM1353101.1 HAMP domain-containing histidine kinase [Bacteroides sp.]MCM1442423.1 HAMP domain-containing histidine kinase [Muribaculum sp.]MCM1481266.1 HAMP domain-containing histidine kinase [Paludibacter sp.]